MDKLKVVWNRRALRCFDRIAEWYSINMGKQAASKFAKGIQNTLHTLSYSPQIGLVDESRSTKKTTYYSFLSHPKYRIVYRYTPDKLVVVTIHSNLMKPKKAKD
ncbi:MAG: type II toxin-antitoxin system RelE/ParE family toxin [Bacteroidaceae bacterium]|nr:type II toxin-antitoxin system RelE/ParE family toxin [Bacteroidaceae bacterium]